MHQSEEQLTHFTLASLNLPANASVKFTPIYKGGSDRLFFRVHIKSQEYDTRCILISYNKEKKENALYANLARFLKDMAINTPGILGHDSENLIIWMEDLGQTDLHSKKDTSWTERSSYYKQVLEQIHILHDRAVHEIDQRQIATLPGFNLDQYEWEHHYFLENLVHEYFQFTLDDHDTLSLGEELGHLKNTLLVTSPAIVHRDFQSQNILLKNDKTYLIDFQGMRPGCLFYDLGSLLYDPYVHFSIDQRLELLEYYYKLKQNRTHNWKAFCKHFHEAAAQRLMQALGAYGFLGLKRKKTDFLQHIPKGLSNLQETTQLAETLPCLNDLSQKLIDYQEIRTASVVN
ncbi:MAG: phosphotransferase [Verrucomicrobiota bacterium]